MSNLHKCAKDHIQACKTDFEFRSKNPGTSTGSAGRVVPQMNEIFGPEHKALEGFEQYDESLQAALIEAMTSHLEKASLAKDTPMPSVLGMEKRKE